jgi:hypothetical protein
VQGRSRWVSNLVQRNVRTKTRTTSAEESRQFKPHAEDERPYKDQVLTDKCGKRCATIQTSLRKTNVPFLRENFKKTG